MSTQNTVLLFNLFADGDSLGSLSSPILRKFDDELSRIRNNKNQVSFSKLLRRSGSESKITPTVTTNKNDYQPGETAYITAKGFTSGDTVQLQVLHLDSGADGRFGTSDDQTIQTSGEGHEAWQVTDGSALDLDGKVNGKITTTWYVNPDDSLNATFKLTAKSINSGQEANHIFTDSLSLDLGSQTFGFVNGAYIARSNVSGSSGTGTINSFLRIKNSPSEQGYNTNNIKPSQDPTLKDVIASFTRSLKLSELPTVQISGQNFREIRLDLNESNSNPLITLQKFQVFMGNSGNLIGYNTNTGTLNGALNNGQAVFNLGTSVIFNASLQPGSGAGDGLFYIPDSMFAGYANTSFVYLYTKFDGSESGFEEFSVAARGAIVPSGGISGRVFNDLNGDGDDESGVDSGLNNVTLKLFLDDGDGVFEANEGSFDPTKDSLITTKITSGNGGYSFTNLLSGNYFVQEILLSGFFPTPAGSNNYRLVTVGTSNTTGINFGNFQLGSISGQKFQDTDGDGIKDAGETGLSGWSIFIDTDNDGIKDAGEISTTTDADGNYSFNGLTTGSYTIREVQQTGWVQTTSNPSAINITSGTNITGIDFGNFQLGSISGQKFQDTDGDGIKDAGETGLSGWSIFIDTDNDGIKDAGEISTTTDADGNYSFNGLTTGSYTIREVQQTGWVQTTSNPSPINITSGTNVTGIDFGNRQTTNLQILKSFNPTFKGLKVAIPDEQISFKLTAKNAGPTDAQYILVSDTINPAQLIVQSVTTPEGWINLDTYDPNNDGILDGIDSDGDGNIDFIGDGNKNTIQVLIPSLLNGAEGEITVQSTVSSDTVTISNFFGVFGENSALQEYSNVALFGKSYLPLNLRKEANSSIINFRINNIGNSTANITSSVADSDTSDNFATDYATIPTYTYSAALGNGENFNALFGMPEENSDPHNPDYSLVTDADYCISTTTGSIITQNCSALIASGLAYNQSAFLPNGTQGNAGFHVEWDNKELLESSPGWSTFLAASADGDLTDSSDEEYVLNFLSQLVANGHTAPNIYVEGELQLVNPQTGQTQSIVFTQAQITPDLATQTIILVKNNGVFFADENLTPGVQIVGVNNLQLALDTLPPATNTQSSLKIVIDSQVTTTRLETLNSNSLSDKGYIVTDLQILGNTITFDAQNGSGDIDLSLIQVTAPTNANITIQGGNATDKLRGSARAETILGNNGADIIIGGLGSDKLFGKSGMDLLRGDGGDDLLVGGQGGDTLRGSFGADILIGANYDPLTNAITQDGGAADIYVLEANAGLDIVRGYQVGSDKIGLLGINLNSLSLTQQGVDAVISFNGADLMRVEGVCTQNLAFTTNFTYI